MPAEAPALLLRADAGPGIGSGHVARLLALAEAWIDAGGRATLLTAAVSKPLAVRAGALGVVIRPISAPHPDPSDLAALTAAIAAEGVRPWVAVDGYIFDAAYLRAAGSAGARVLAVDDIPRLEEYPVTVLLNQNPGAEKGDYPLPADALPLLGPRWSLLRPDYAQKGALRAPRADATKILVSFGGADPGDASGLAIKALKRLKRPYEAVVVAGPDNPRGAELERAAAGASIRVEKAANMPALMADADLALLGGGVTMLEACVMGLPVLVATIAANQEPGALALSESGAVRLLGTASALSDEELAAAFDALLSDSAARAALALAALAVADGRGAPRVAAVLLALSEAKLGADWVRLRPAAAQDALEVWRLANDPDVRRNSFRKDPIPLSAHLDWFAARLKDRAERFWILDAGGVVAGQVRYAKTGEEAEVHYSVRGAFRGKGLGTLALQASRGLACKDLGVKKLTGVVITPNEPSERSFLSAGWTKKGVETRDDARCAVFEVLCS